MNIHSHGVMKVSHTWNKFECRISVYVRNSTEEDIQNIQRILLFPFFLSPPSYCFVARSNDNSLKLSERKIGRNEKKIKIQLFIRDNYL